MKILFIFTGGTIGSTLHGDIISPDGNKPRAIIEAYRLKFGIAFSYSIEEPYTELSEYNTGEHVKKLCDCVLSNLDKDYDGIIVTHGTDTLQYSAAALGYAAGSESIPICLVSANRPIENEKSNALDNLHAAVKFIEKSLGRGVFVTYRNDTDDVTKVHRATRLVSSRSFSDEVASIFDLNFGYFDKSFDFHKNYDYKENEDVIKPLVTSEIGEYSKDILVISPYVGMNYPILTSQTKYILLDSYHSGTINTKSTKALEFFATAKKLEVKIFLTGVTYLPEYESATIFEELGIIPIKNISLVSAYVKLWLISSLGLSAEKYIDKSLSGDIAP